MNRGNNEDDDDDYEDEFHSHHQTSSTAPIFDSATELVEFSLGINRSMEFEEVEGEEDDDDDDDDDEEEEYVQYEHEAMSVGDGSEAPMELEEDEDEDGGDQGHGGGELTRAYYSASEQDERIRAVTNEYLEGRISLLEFASAIEHFGRFELAVEEEEDQEGDEDDGGEVEDETPIPVKKTTRPVPSLVLLKPENVDEPVAGPSSRIEFQEESFTEEESEKLKGEFFRSGDEPATFSVRKRRKMSPTVKNLMGEAHVRFARGDWSGAETICMEVIKEQPTYKDPFHTLAMIYENQGNKSKSLQFYLICALLDPKRCEDWPRLADLSMEEDNTQQAIMCLNKALNREPSNVTLHLKRCQLLKNSGDNKSALKGYHKAYQLTSDGKVKMDVAKEISHLYFQMEEMDNAYNILRTTFDENPDHVTFYELNLLAEVCITVKKYPEALELFVKHGNLIFVPPFEPEDFQTRESITSALSLPKRDFRLPVGLHSDLTQKIAIVLIHLEAYKLAEQIVNRLMAEEDIDEFGLQFFEIAEAYISKKETRAALRLLNPLVNSESYSEAEVWLRFAECLYMINKLEDAAEAYEKVISLAPNHKVAKLNLSIILQKMGKYDGALESLDQNTLEDLVDPDLLLERCKIFLNQGRLRELYETAMILFSRHSPRIRDSDECHVLISTSNSHQQQEGLKSFRFRSGEPVLDQPLMDFEDKPLNNPFREWRVYVMLMRIFLNIGRWDLMQRLSYTVWPSKLFALEPDMKDEMDLHAAFASVLCGPSDLTSLHFRFLLTGSSYTVLSTLIVNLLTLAFRNSKSKFSTKQIKRLLNKHPKDLRLRLLSAHSNFSTGMYKHALIEYLQIIQELPTNPLCHLMVAVTVMHMVAQRTTSSRLRLVLYMIGYLRKYMELRGRCQESYYNMARAYHFIGLHTHALRYYKKVLTSKPVEDNGYYGGPPVREDGSHMFVFGNQLDLTMEAAYNIAHIYRGLGMSKQARMYLFKYITI